MQIRIATRQSPLALWQANWVKDRLQQQYPQAEISLLPMTTEGDRRLGGSLAQVGGKALFVKELEQALLTGEADIAVHSMKDVPMELPDGLCLTAICQREDPHDALVSNQFASLDALPLNARVGTASLRRRCQLAALRPDLQLDVLRGNVNTRLARLDEGQFDAIVLAAAGLKRLGFAARIRQILPAELMLPAVGQGALGIECRTQDAELRQQLQILNDATTQACLSAERAFNSRLGAGCQAPVAGFALRYGESFWLRGKVGTLDGQTLLAAELRGTEPEALGRALADQLIEQGALSLLAAHD